MRFGLRAALTTAVIALVCSCGTSPSTRIERAKAMFDQGRYEDAQIEYRKALQSNSQQAEAWRALGVTYLKLSKPEAAHESFQQALALRPNDTETATHLARLLVPAYWQSGHKAKPLAAQLEKLAGVLLASDPQSYWGQRIEGHLALAADQPKKAFSRFQGALTAKPGDPDAAYMLLTVAYESMSAAEAEAFARGYLAENPTVPSAYDFFAGRLAKAGKLAEAERYRRLWIQHIPNDLNARQQLALFLHSFGKNAEAEQAIAELTTFHSKNVRARILSGEYYQLTGSIERSLAEYRAGEKEDVNNALAYQKRQISVLLQEKDLPRAKAVLDSVPLKARKDPELQLAQAMFDIDSKDPVRLDQAIRVLQQLGAGNGVAALQLGDALVLKGDAAGALASYQASARLNPSDPLPRLALMRYFASRLRYREAAEQAEAVLNIAPLNREAHLQRIAAFRSLGRIEVAENFLNQTRRARNASSFAEDLDLEHGLNLVYQKRYLEAESVIGKHYRAGHPNTRLVAGYVEALTAQRKYAESQAILAADLRVRPGRAVLIYALGEVQLKLGQDLAALESFRQAREIAPAMLEAYRRAAEVDLNLGNVDQAVAVLRMGIQKFPSDPSLVAVYARGLEMKGDVASAEKAYREWIRLDPKSPFPLNNLAFLLADTSQRSKEAVDLAALANRMAPNNPDFADTLGYAYWRHGQHRAGIDVLSRLTQSRPEPIFNYHYALVLLSSGRTSQARVVLETALRRNPEPKLKKKILESLART